MPKTNPQIKFGTDGWRAIIADKFTFDNVAKVSEAVAVYLTNTKTKPKVAVGYDTRFLSAEFAAKSAEVLSASGCDALLSNTFISTPALSCAVTDNRADLGIMISASHNPAYFNGFKIKTSDGCSAPETVTKAVENNIISGRKAAKAAGNIKNIDFASPYLKRIASMIDFKLLNDNKLSVVADPMFGAGIGYIESLLQETPAEVLSIHSNPDPMFGGLHPEPIEINLGDLKKAVKETGADAGLATDGDADRIGVVDDKGNYYSPHQVFPLLLYYLCKYKKMKGKVVQTISLGYLSERIAKDYNLPFEEVPVGFKYIAEKILSERILMGGEESGGYGYGNFLPYP